MITEAEVEWEQDEGSHRTLLQEEEVGESALDYKRSKSRTLSPLRAYTE